MVQTHRTASKATIAKDVSPMRNMEINKQALTSSSSAAANGFGASVGAQKGASAASKSSADKWKYNNMVNNQREQFNSLHFC